MSESPGTTRTAAAVQEYDTRFALHSLDDPPSTEVGVILFGLDAPRLLAGLGLAALADDPGGVAMAVDRLRHGRALDMAAMVAEGARRWREARPALAAADPDPSTSASVRQAWERAHRVLGAAGLDEVGPASRVYLTACWLRRVDIDAAVATTEDPT